MTTLAGRARAARLLDGLTAALLALTLVVIATGGFRVPLGTARLPLTRAEDVFLAAVVAALLRHAVRPWTLEPAAPRRALVWGVVVYSLVFSFITVTRHYVLQTHALDLGLYDQIMWSIAQGLGPMVSLPDMHAWGDHLTLIQYPLSLLYLVAPAVSVMLVLQSVVFALGALAVYGFSRARLGHDGPAAALGLLYLVNPSLHGINLRDFHPQAMAIPLLLGAVYAFETRRTVWFWVLVVLALSAREDAALPVVGLGLWALARRRHRTGAALVVVGLAWLFVATTVVIPHFRGAPYSHLHARYGYLGDSVAGILLGMILHPLTVLGTVLSARRIVYLAAILAPFAFLPLLAPLSLVPALPALVENLLSRDPILFHYRTQYNVFILPFLAVGAALGYERLAERRGGTSARAALGVAFLVSLALTARTVNDLMVTRWWPGERERAAHAVLARVPPLASISTEERLVPHLTHRPKAWIFPTGVERSGYVLLDVNGYPSSKVPDYRLERRGNVVSVIGGPTGAAYRYEVVAEQAPFVLLKRAGG